MSTNYYAVRSGYRVEPLFNGNPACNWWNLNDVRGVFGGNIRREFLSAVADRDELVALRAGGSLTVTSSLPDATWVISEYGEPVTLGDLRKGVAP